MLVRSTLTIKAGLYLGLSLLVITCGRTPPVALTKTGTRRCDPLAAAQLGVADGVVARRRNCTPIRREAWLP